jgi:hypothetical protein
MGSFSSVQGSRVQVSSFTFSFAAQYLTPWRFYYVDERKEDGAPKYRVDGEAHANIYWDLAHGQTQGPWMQTFVKGVGYKKFDDVYGA